MPIISREKTLGVLSVVNHNSKKPFKEKDEVLLTSLAGYAAIALDNATLYQQAEQLVVDDAACIPLWFGKTYLLIKPYVKNYKLDIQGIPTLSDVYIEE